MTAADLLAYVSSEGIPTSSADEAYAGECWEEASYLVGKHTGLLLTDNGMVGDGPVIPRPVLFRSILEVGAELFHRRETRNGVSQFAAPDGGAGIRIARDPMVAAYPILAPYVGRGIA